MSRPIKDQWIIVSNEVIWFVSDSEPESWHRCPAEGERSTHPKSQYWQTPASKWSWEVQVQGGEVPVHPGPAGPGSCQVWEDRPELGKSPVRERVLRWECSVQKISTLPWDASNIIFTPKSQTWSSSLSFLNITSDKCSVLSRVILNELHCCFWYKFISGLFLVVVLFPRGPLHLQIKDGVRHLFG